MSAIPPIPPIPLCPATSRMLLPQCGQVSCGFPSPAADYQQPDLSLDELVGLHPTSSLFLFRAWGDSMRNAGIFDGSVLIIDKAKTAKTGNIVVAVVGPEFLVKRLARDSDDRPMLVAENDAYPPVHLGDDESLEIWGVVVWVLTNVGGPMP